MWLGCAAPATLLVGLCCDSAMALDNGLAGTPARGWRSWNTPSRTGCLDDASCSFNGICKQQQCHCVSG
eukprot:SAG31_NODE_47169_length_251_cov_1.006579_1_plen_68_part_01